MPSPKKTASTKKSSSKKTASTKKSSPKKTASTKKSSPKKTVSSNPKITDTLLDKSKKILNKSLTFAKNNRSKIAAGVGLALYANTLRKVPFIQKQFSDLKSKLTGVSPIVKNLIGDIFANEYEVQGEILGRGTFGIAYLSENKKTKEKVVIKQIDMGVPLDVSKQRLIMNEIKVLQEISQDKNNKYTTKYITHKFAEGDSNIYIIFSYKEKTPLGKTSLKNLEPNLNTGISNDNKFKIVKNLICGINFLHSKNIAHNDIKIDNIVFNPKDGCVEYIDFGISCLNSCMAPETSGSPLYMPPELLKVIRLMQLNFYSKPFNEYIFSSIVLNKRFKYDIWALGIVINIILYNRYPFDVKPVIDMPAVNIYNSEIRTPDFSHLNDTLVPKQYNDILRKMLEVDPSKRASASELVKMI